MLTGLPENTRNGFLALALLLQKQEDTLLAEQMVLQASQMEVEFLSNVSDEDLPFLVNQNFRTDAGSKLFQERLQKALIDLE